MFVRLVRPSSSYLRHAPPRRHMGASAKQLLMRIKSIRSTQKISKAMKMIADAKLGKSQQRLAAARNFSAAIVRAWPETDPKVVQEFVDKRGTPLQTVVTPVSADKGMCGPMNATVVRATRLSVNTKLESKQAFKLFTFGEKARSGLERLFGTQFSSAITDAAKRPPSFRMVAMLADQYLTATANVDKREIIFNAFKNMLTFNTTTHPLYSLDIFKADARTVFRGYNFSGDNEVMQNFYEFRTMVLFWQIIAETETCELSSRSSAMNNSMNNANDLLLKLQLYYNRSRQSKITLEICEIVSGAAAIDDSKKG